MRQKQMAVILDAVFALDERHREVAELSEHVGDRTDADEVQIVRRIAEALCADQSEQAHRKRAADGTADPACPRLVGADMHRHFALAEPHAEIHRERIAGKRDEERRKHIDLAEALVHPQQEDAAIHHRKHDAADDGNGNITEGKRFLTAVGHDGDPEQEDHQDQRQKEPTAKRRVRRITVGDQVCRIVPFAPVVNDPFRKGGDPYRHHIHLLGYILPRRVQQLIRRYACDTAHEQQRCPRRAQKQHRQQRRQSNDHDQPSLFHPFASL